MAVMMVETGIITSTTYSESDRGGDVILVFIGKVITCLAPHVHGPIIFSIRFSSPTISLHEIIKKLFKLTINKKIVIFVVMLGLLFGFENTYLASCLH
jgi:hypothetical protein